MFCGIPLVYTLCVSCRHCVSVCTCDLNNVSVYFMTSSASAVNLLSISTCFVPLLECCYPGSGVSLWGGSMEIWLFFCLNLLTICRLRRQKARPRG